MNTPLRRWTRGLGVLVLILAYAILSHLSNLLPHAQALGVVLALAPLLAAVLALLWRGSARLQAVLFAGVSVAVLVRWWPQLAGHIAWIYLAQQAGCYVLLGVVFGRSLLAGREPLCSQWASRVHGPLSPALRRYTRAVTVAWTLFFASVATTQVLLFALAPLPVWSAFANIVCLPLVAAMFVGEYLVRGRVLPDMEHAGILEGVRAFLRSSGSGVAWRG